MSFLERAGRLIPGGVSSPARAFGVVGGDPVVVSHGAGSTIVDVDGNRYIDYLQGFGSVILGHADPRVTEAVVSAAGRGGATGLASEAEVALADRIVGAVPGVERVRFLTSGTEAAMTAARIARAATGRDVLVKFEGCYHGHADAFLAKAGSGVATFGVPMADGVPRGSVADTIVVGYGDLDALAVALERGDVAAVFVEPIAANMGVVVPDETFLPSLTDLAHSHGALVVADEVVTGFRVGPGSVTSPLRPDLVMFGKVVGGGLPIGVVGGRADLMDRLAPTGTVYQAGTYAAHPHAMAAGAAVLEVMDAAAYDALERTATRLFDGLAEEAAATGAEVSVVRAGTFGCVWFAAAAPVDLGTANASDRDAFARFHRALRARGVLIPPSPFEAWFPSMAHSARDIDDTLAAAREAFAAAG